MKNVVMVGLFSYAVKLVLIIQDWTEQIFPIEMNLF